MKIFFVYLFALVSLSAEAGRYDLFPGQSINLQNRYGGTDLVTCNSDGYVTPPAPTPPGAVWEGRVVGYGPGCNGGRLNYNPSGTSCYAGDNRYSANCYYVGASREQWVFTCPASARGTWRSRIVGNGPGCNGGSLNYNPVGQSCTVGDRSSYPQNCYYLGTGNDGRDQYVFECLP